MIPKDLLDLLACPACKGPLSVKDSVGLRCAHCGVLYPVRDGIPILLKSEATPDS